MPITVKVGRLCCEQRGRRPAEFRILSFVAGRPVARNAVGLVGPRLEACTAAGVTGTPRAPRGIRGDGYRAYGGSVVSGS